MTEAGQSSSPAPAVLGHRQILIAFSGLVLAMLLAALDSTIVSTALPTIVSEMGGLEHLAWVVTGYLLAQTIVTPVYGKLGDLYGRKIVMQSAIVLFLIGSALCGLSQNMTQLILFRAIQGLGGGGLVVTTQAVVGDIVPEIQYSPADIQSFGVSTVTELLSELAPETRSDRGRGGESPVILPLGRIDPRHNHVRPQIFEQKPSGASAASAASASVISRSILDSGRR